MPSAGSAAAAPPTTLAAVSWKIEFFSEDGGRQPVRDWLVSLNPSKRAAAIAAIELVLAELGLDVCKTEYGKALGKGLFEFRIRHDEEVTRSKAGGQSAATTPANPCSCGSSATLTARGSFSCSAATTRARRRGAGAKGRRSRPPASVCAASSCARTAPALENEGGAKEIVLAGDMAYNP